MWWKESKKQKQAISRVKYLIFIILTLNIRFAMKSSKTILNYYIDLDLKFNELFLEVLNDFNENAVHNFRVNIKKQVAFFHLLDCIAPKFQAFETQALFFRIFKKAGAIRKVHIEKNILTNKDLEIKVAPEIIQNLDKQLAKKVERFLQHDYAEDLKAINKKSKTIKRLIQQVSRKNLNNGLNEYFRKLLHGLKKMSDSCKASEDAFHDLRKLLKELFYNLFLINQLFEHNQLTTGVLKYLDRLQTSLGEWHDIHLTFKHFLALEKPEFEEMIEILKRKNDEYVEKIRTQLIDFEAVLSEIELELSVMVA